MSVTNCCKSYFSGFQEVSHARHNDSRSNVLAALKIISYATLIIPVAFAAVYGVATLAGRFSQKHSTSNLDGNVQLQAHNILLSSAIPEVSVPSDLLGSSQIELAEVLKTYSSKFQPQLNRVNLLEYGHSTDFVRHANTARIYYNRHQLSESDALKIVYHREPTNIAMGTDQYNKEYLEYLFGYREGIYNDASARKSDGTLFRERPNTAAVYSETYMWNPPGGDDKKEIACLSLPAPALDSAMQPHYAYYMASGSLEVNKYELEMEFLFKIVDRVVRDNKDLAFSGRGIRRIVLSRFGQGAFLGALTPLDQDSARIIYKRQMALFLERMEGINLEIVMSEHVYPRDDVWHSKMIVGDIIETTQEGDLIVNAWDPHSAPGNGNDADRSFDGAMGKGSGILLTQTSWLNNNLRNKRSLVAVG